MEKQYAGPITVRALLDKLKNLFAAKESVDELSAGVAYINATDNETITDVNTSPSGPASIDVTAEVGQTIIVKEVDANGKPTKWESAEYQPRTHWVEETVILPETVVECSELDEDEDGVGDGFFAGMLPDISLTPNVQYDVYYNGMKYSCTAGLFQDDEEERILILGNLGAVTGEGDTGEPFVMQLIYYPSDGSSQNMIVSLDGSTSVTLSITQVEYTPIPREYLANTVYYIDVTGSGTTDDPYTCKETVQELARIYNSGQQMVARTGVEENGVAIYTHHNLALGRTDGVMFWFIYYMGSSATSRLLFQSADGITYTIIGND